MGKQRISDDRLGVLESRVLKLTGGSRTDLFGVLDLIADLRDSREAEMIWRDLAGKHLARVAQMEAEVERMRVLETRRVKALKLVKVALARLDGATFSHSATIGEISGDINKVRMEMCRAIDELGGCGTGNGPSSG